MVSPQRVKTKLERFHAKIMAYEEMLTTGTNPVARDVIGRHESRLGLPINDLEKAQAVIAQCDIYRDVERNLEKVNLSLKDYCADLEKRGIKDYPLVLQHLKKDVEEMDEAKKKGMTVEELRASKKKGGATA